MYDGSVDNVKPQHAAAEMRTMIPHPAHTNAIPPNVVNPIPDVRGGSAYGTLLQVSKHFTTLRTVPYSKAHRHIPQVCEAALHKAPSFETAMDVFDQLGALGTHGVGSGVKTHASAGGGGALGLQLQQLASNTRIYNGLLAAAGRTGRWQEAQHLYALMKEVGGVIAKRQSGEREQSAVRHRCGAGWADGVGAGTYEPTVKRLRWASVERRRWRRCAVRPGGGGGAWERVRPVR